MARMNHEKLNLQRKYEQGTCDTDLPRYMVEVQFEKNDTKYLYRMEKFKSQFALSEKLFNHTIKEGILHTTNNGKSTTLKVRLRVK